MDNHGQFVSFSSLTGQSKACQSQGRDSLILLARSIKQKNSLVRMDQSRCTAGKIHTSNWLSLGNWHTDILILYLPEVPSPTDTGLQPHHGLTSTSTSKVFQRLCNSLGLHFNQCYWKHDLNTALFFKPLFLVLHVIVSIVVLHHLPLL